MAPALDFPPLLKVWRNRTELYQQAGALFIELSKRAISAKGFFTVALSGGATPRGLYLSLANPVIQKQVSWDKIHFFWGDERFVPKDHPDSNSGWVKKNFFSKIAVPESNIHPIETDGVSPQEAAMAYEKRLKIFFTGGGFPGFDLVFLGLGEDGHTASLFPGLPEVEEQVRWVVAPDVKKGEAARITLTLPVFNSADQIVFLVAGQEKAAVLKAVFDPRKKENYPAGRVQPIQGSLLFYVDQAAIGQLYGKNVR